MTMPDTTETRDVVQQAVDQVILYLQEEADFNRSWTDGRREQPAGSTPGYIARRIELAEQRELWASHLASLVAYSEQVSGAHRDAKTEIERLSRELLEAKEALVHYDHFLIDLTEDFIGSFDAADLQDMLVANGLYVIEDFDPAKHHDWSGAAEPGDDFYTPSDVVLKTRSVLSPKKDSETEVSRERETG